MLQVVNSGNVSCVGGGGNMVSTVVRANGRYLSAERTHGGGFSLKYDKSLVKEKIITV